MNIGIDDQGNPVTLANSRVPIQVLGIPGVGKSTLLGVQADEAIDQDEGVIVFDIKDGQLARDLAGRTRHPDKLIYVEFKHSRRFTHPWSLNLLEHTDPAAMVDAVMELFQRLGVFTEEMTLVKQNLLFGLWLASTDPQATIFTLIKLLTESRERRRLLAMAHDLEPRVVDYWQAFDARGNRDGSMSKAQIDLVRSTTDRLDAFLIGQPLSGFLRQPTTTLRLAEWLDAGKLIVCNFVDGVPFRQVRQLGNIVMAALVNAAQARPTSPDNRYWRVIADEFDQLAADPFIHSIDKLRASHVLPIMANQNLSQLPSELTNSLSGAPVRLFFRVTGEDATLLARQLRSEEEAALLASLPDHQVRVHQGRRPFEPGSDKLWLFQALAYLNSPTAVTATTNDWPQEFDHQALDRAIAQAQHLTTPTPTTTEVPHGQHFPPAADQSRPPVGAQALSPGSNLVGRPDPTGARPVPTADQSTGGRIVVSPDTDRGQHSPLRSDGPESHQRDPTSPDRHRFGHSDAGDHHSSTDSATLRQPPQPAHRSGSGDRPSPLQQRRDRTASALAPRPPLQLPVQPPGSPHSDQ